MTVSEKQAKIGDSFKRKPTLMRSIKNIGLSENRRVVRDGSEIFPTGLGVPSRKRVRRVYGEAADTVINPKVHVYFRRREGSVPFHNLKEYT